MAIKDTAKVLISVFGKEKLFRVGGDEFIAVLGNTTQDETDHLFRLVELALIEENKTEKAYKTALSLSKGCSEYQAEKDKGYREVFRRADEAMYEDKAEYYRKHDRRRSSGI